MNAYWCHLEGRIVGRSYDPPDPGEFSVPCGIYIAETRGQAKRMLIAEHSRDVYPEEFVDVRTNLLQRHVARDLLPGPLPSPDLTSSSPTQRRTYYKLWLLVPQETEAFA